MPKTSTSKKPAPPSRSRSTFRRHVAPFAPLAIALAVGATQPQMHKTTSTKTNNPPVVESGFAQGCSSPKFPTDAETAMDQTSCSVAGKGGKETFQNEAKNNFCAVGPGNTPSKPDVLTIAEMVALQKKAEDIPNINFGNTREHPLTSNPGPVQDRKALQELGEGKLVQLIGFVKVARQEGAESVNCGHDVSDDPVNHDIHISIVLNSADPECAGIVAEMSPHHRPEAWSAQLVNQVGKAGLLVRLTGQQMFDSSHTPCQNGSPIQGDPSRISLWEVHPIYKFEVCPQGNCSSGGWVPLEAWKKS